MNQSPDIKADLTQSLKTLHLPTIRQCYEEVARQAEREQPQGTKSVQNISRLSSTFLRELAAKAVNVRKQDRPNTSNRLTPFGNVAASSILTQSI